MKLELIHELQQQGKRVGMIGDGINAPALIAADVGLAIGGGADISRPGDRLARHRLLPGDAAAAGLNEGRCDDMPHDASQRKTYHSG